MDDENCGGSLWGVKVEIQELEQKIEAAKEKTLAHYQEWLGNLYHAWEALQEELLGLRKEGTVRAPPPSTSLQAISRWEEPASPMGHGMPRVLRSLSPWEILQAMSGTKSPLEEGETDIPNGKEEGSAEHQQQERVQEAQAKFNQKNPPGTFLARARKAREVWQEQWEALSQWAWERKTKWKGQWAQARPHQGRNCPHAEATMCPILKLPHNHVSSDQAP